MNGGSVPHPPHPAPATPGGERARPKPDHGVDVTLIRWALSLTPQERMDALKANTDALIRLRNAAAPQR